ncbi:unnamed protein product [Haemonchus placei]|uniref:CPSF_A domain-containing protein n=1 Tax=Haemonchus placei TaxID=6290 RepID=A0A0N4W8C5_HAEPC|nr:unnamed protein product [Haemonchus placei]
MVVEVFSASAYGALVPLKVWRLYSEADSSIYMFERSCSSHCRNGCTQLADMEHRFVGHLLYNAQIENSKNNEVTLLADVKGSLIGKLCDLVIT